MYNQCTKEVKTIMAEFPQIRIAVSDCLLGTECRYNGGHAQDQFILKQLSKYTKLMPFCPEAVVIGTPRETIRLVGHPSEGQSNHIGAELNNIEVKVIGPKSGTDYTKGLQEYNDKMIPKLLEQKLDGAIVKARSPSCGLERIKIYQPSGEWHGSKDPMVAGKFTSQLKSSAPNLAIEEEGRLSDAWLRESFMMQVFTSARWREFLESEPSLHDFQTFHRDHKYLLLSKNEVLYREMGALVATTRKTNLTESIRGYEEKLFKLLSYRSKKGQICNTLDHIYGYFKTKITEHEKQHYLTSRDEFMQDIIPLIAVIKILEQFLNHYGSNYLASQVFFNPYPADLSLRSKTTAYR